MYANLADFKRIVSAIFMVIAPIFYSGCKTVLFAPSTGPQAVQIPYLKNNANECYYIDDFMPTPDGLVSGRSGAMNLRYYSYKTASYKELRSVQVNLAFYSSDMRCWSLFEEFYTKE